MQLSIAEAWSFGAIAVTAVVFVALERWAPYDQGQSLVRPGFWVDFVFYNLVQTWLLGVVIGSLWDWLFGTAYFPYPRERKARRYGLDYAGLPQGYVGQVLRAFGHGPFDHEPATGPARERPA